MRLWSKNIEKIFFNKYKDSTLKRELFHETKSGEYVAYWPKTYIGAKKVLSSRNLLIRKYIQNWVCELLKHMFEEEHLYVIQQAQIPLIGISHKSSADIVIATKNKKILMPDEVKLIFELKMSIVWNWKYSPDLDEVVEIGDYRSHQGKPSFTCSNSILNTISKFINIRVSNINASKIPFIVLGNTPLSNGFSKKADFLKTSGIIQGFWSLNPFPLNKGNTKKKSHKNGFIRMDNTDEFKMYLNQFFEQDLNFFSGMKNPERLGQIIEMANECKTYKNKGLKFLNLLKM